MIDCVDIKAEIVFSLKDHLSSRKIPSDMCISLRYTPAIQNKVAWAWDSTFFISYTSKISLLRSLAGSVSRTWNSRSWGLSPTWGVEIPLKKLISKITAYF